MNRNQKIALGCGGAGCLGLIVVVIAGLLIYFLAYNSPRTNRNFNSNVSTNRNSNSNDNSDLSSNANDDSSDSSNSSSAEASSLSDDDKHKLYQAAGMTGDAELLRRVSIKIGLVEEDYTPRENYETFIGQHVEWTLRNTNFIQSISTPEKARAYVEANLPD